MISIIAGVRTIVASTRHRRRSRRRKLAISPVTPLLLLLAVLTPACGDRVSAPETTPPEHDFSPTELLTIRPFLSQAWAISESGVAAGWVQAFNGRTIVWNPDGHAHMLMGADATPFGMNAEGSVVGYSVSPATGWRQQGFAFVDGSVQLLDRLDPEHDAQAWTINANRVVAGVSSGWAVVWEPGADGRYRPPYSLGLRRMSMNNTEGAHINGRGDVAFTAQDPECCDAVLWLRRSDGGYGDPVILGRTHAGAHYARGINDAGIVVGYRWSGTEEIAVAWLPADYSNPVDLGPGQAWHVNNRNQVVGTIGGELAGFYLEFVRSRPALWLLNTSGGFTGPMDLGTPPRFRSGGARFISDSGWIAGSSWGVDWEAGSWTATRWRLPPSLRPRD
jgi:hypothetical protein